ncbi:MULTISPECIES: YbaK/EbsC family protein [Vibrio]|uniref:Cys-tRNA(Pro)/Cys-tRNA(Cys) deacylase n=2 Tax=Vibrio TaxID=662 RepID=A0A7X4RWY8_9VIBR|nr:MULTISPECIES: YbaK/EbsC family protein [Vibrio]MBF9001343.1 Cys-tRNA(Pro) deacylase [Vibrio nitrifigilis]MZI95890.1 Cys-tRNA(Pro) deacylase [Vibrio eleionomae]
MQETVREILSESGFSYSIETYEYNPQGSAIGVQAAKSMGQAETNVAKTLIIEVDKKHPVCAVLPAHKKTNMEAIAALIDGKKARMMNAEKSTQMTGFQSGGTSPLGVFKLMPVFIAQELEQITSMYVNAGGRGVVVKIAPQHLAQITSAKFVDISI